MIIKKTHVDVIKENSLPHILSYKDTTWLLDLQSGLTFVPEP